MMEPFIIMILIVINYNMAEYSDGGFCCDNIPFVLEECRL